MLLLCAVSIGFFFLTKAATHFDEQLPIPYTLLLCHFSHSRVSLVRYSLIIHALMLWLFDVGWVFVYCLTEEFHREFQGKQSWLQPCMYKVTPVLADRLDKEQRQRESVNLDHN